MRASSVASRLVVLAAIELHREAELRTVEVQDKGACGVLAPELGSRYLADPQTAPEQSLGIGVVGLRRRRLSSCGLGRRIAPFPTRTPSGERPSPLPLPLRWEREG